jgi:hypothetical protein
MGERESSRPSASKLFDGVIWKGEHVILALLTNARRCAWGCFAEFHGTAEELIAAGIATCDMFEGLGKSRQRTCRTEYGECTVKPRRGKWDLEMRTFEDEMATPTDESSRSRKWWAKHGAEAEAETRKILAALGNKVGTPHG